MDCLLIRSFALESFLAFSFLGQLLFNSFIVKDLRYNFPILNKEMFCQTFFILICSLLIISNLKLETFFYNFIFINNSSIYFFKLGFLVFSIISLILIYRLSLIQNINELEFFSIFLLAVFASLLLVSSYDLLSLYLLLEMQSLCFYALASFKKNSAASIESGLKYFILGSIASCFFLLGISIMYGCFGTLNFNDLLVLLSFNFDNDFFNLNIPVFFGLFFVLVVFFFKLGAFPFHWWQPDVYEGAPTSSTLIFILLPKFIFIGFLLKFFYIFFKNFSIIQDLFLISGVLTILVGSIFATQQKRLKRFLIYTSIAQVGFLISTFITLFVEGYSFIYFFLIVYLVSSSTVWGFYSILYYSQQNINTFKGYNSTQLFLISLKNFFSRNKIWAFAFLIVFFSFAGIPPLWGFFAKFFILFEILKNSYFFTTCFIVLISSISVYYYIRIIKIIFFESSKQSTHVLSILTSSSLTSLEYLVLSIGLVLITFGFVVSDVLLIFSQKLILGLCC